MCAPVKACALVSMHPALLVCLFVFQALEEPNFSIAYANLCKVMSPIKVEFILDGGKTKKSTNFRRMLLTKCQTEFEKDKKDDETLEKMREGIKEAETVCGGRGGGEGVIRMFRGYACGLEGFV